MPKGYMIFHVTITDADNYPKYMQAAGAFITSMGGVYIARGGQNEGVEGTLKQRHVIIEFPSYEAAVACYRSEKYQEILKLRQAYGESDVVIVEGNPDL
jgi:uncharacterized protein (DUF1330 family)